MSGEGYAMGEWRMYLFLYIFLQSAFITCYRFLVKRNEQEIHTIWLRNAYLPFSNSNFP